jgi:hypothetical protein
MSFVSNIILQFFRKYIKIYKATVRSQTLFLPRLQTSYTLGWPYKISYKQWIWFIVGLGIKLPHLSNTLFNALKVLYCINKEWTCIKLNLTGDYINSWGLFGLCHNWTDCCKWYKILEWSRKYARGLLTKMSFMRQDKMITLITTQSQQNETK